MTPQQALGQALTLHRVSERLARKQLAQEADLSYPYLSELENGCGKDPSLSLLRRVCEALGIPVSRLLADAERLERGESLLVAPPLPPPPPPGR